MAVSSPILVGFGLVASGSDSQSDSGSDSQSYHRYEDVYVNNTTVRGTLGFLAPEYIHSGKCTLKNDVFTYGTMLLELMSGKTISELNLLAHDDLWLEEWIGDLMNKNELGRVMDPNLQGNYLEEEAEKLLRLALLCLHGDPSIRPEVSEVV
ncbi:LRR receptor kinase BAK1-like [Eucalyptus grandis]|uniref:LRR receptor kinase BAK1-like n=1 Tax=Eucalyptus grandis TaxID=71139 RepID=UPI00192F07B9|nr:LRR receptor kinase BAK1-like [Eucalyptus grandis]